MADIYRLLKHPLKQRVSSKSQGYEKISNLLKSNFFCEFEDLQVNNEDDADLALYKIYILIVKCSSLEKVRVKTFNTVKDYFSYFYAYSEPKYPKLFLLLIPYFLNILEAGLKISRDSDLETFYSSPAYISSFPSTSEAETNTRTLILSDLNKRIFKEMNLSNHQRLIKLLRIGQKTETCPDVLLSLSLNFLLDFISTTNDLFKIKQCAGQDVFPDYIQANHLLEKLRKVKIKSPELSWQYKELKIRVAKNMNNLPIQKPKNEICEFAFDLSKGVLININDINNIRVSIFKVPFNQSLLAVKVYQTLTEEANLKPCKKEIDIYKKLSSLRGDSNCFIKFEGEKLDQQVCMFAYEFAERNLTSEMRVARQSIQERIEIYVKSLIESFCIMEQVGIYHRDVKPDNILVTHDKKLKIIDFNVSSRKKEPIMLETAESKVKGTLKYMAPEVKNAFLHGYSRAKYHKSKADVFSLGLVILEMCFENVDVGNIYKSENQYMVKTCVDRVEIEWIRNLLNSMLQLNYKKRPSFRECSSLIKTLGTIY